MKFSIGDKVILKRTGEEGHVVAYINQQMLEVEVNGTVFPVYMDDIDHPYLTWFTQKKQQKTTKTTLPEQLPVEKEKFRTQRLAKGVYLSFMPEFKANEIEDIVDHVKVYLLNELPQTIQFYYEAKYLDKPSFRHDARLHGFGHIYLHSVAFEDMNDQPRFHWRVGDPAQPGMQVEEGIVRIRPQKLFEHISGLLQKNEPSFSYLLLQDFRPRQKEEQPEKFEIPKPKPIAAGSFAAKTGAPAFSIDLHIEKLVSNRRGLTNADMLRIQLEALERSIHDAIMHRQERMMIIHGLGKGTLREEVHRFLKKVPEVDRYVNEWQGLYGFGATEVFFKY
jgi:hypothetical protein